LLAKKPEGTVGCLGLRVIVDDHREQARSYSTCFLSDNFSGMGLATFLLEQ